MFGVAPTLLHVKSTGISWTDCNGDPMFSPKKVYPDGMIYIELDNGGSFIAYGISRDPKRYDETVFCLAPEFPEEDEIMFTLRGDFIKEYEEALSEGGILSCIKLYERFKRGYGVYTEE